MSAGAEPDRGIRLRQHSDWSGATIKSKAMKSTLTTKRRTVQKATQVLAVAPVLATAFFLMWLAVQPLPLHLIDQCGNQRNPRPSASIIVVGVIEADTLVRRPIPMHSDPTYPLQLRRLTVRVENVLKGGSLPKARFITLLLPVATMAPDHWVSGEWATVASCGCDGIQAYYALSVTVGMAALTAYGAALTLTTNPICRNRLTMRW
jgi:hypothetical protein